MSYSIVYDPQDFILVRFQGPLFLAEVRQVMIEVGRLTLEHQCFRSLTNTLNMELKLSMAEVYHVPNMFAELISDFGFQVHKLKRAVIASPDDQMLKFFETVSANHAHNVKLFYDHESARHWLLGT